VGPRAIMDAVVKRNIPSPLQEPNPRTLIVQPVAQRYTKPNVRQKQTIWSTRISQMHSLQL